MHSTITKMVLIAFHFLVDLIFKKNPSLWDLVVIVLCLSLFWFLCVFISSVALTKLAYGKPWLERKLKRDYDNGAKQFYGRIGMQVSQSQHVESMMRGGLARHVQIHLQHLLGGLLCLPAVLNLFEDSSVSSSLVCLGILSEIGWETQDLLSMLYEEAFGSAGTDRRRSSLKPLIVMNLVHHSLAMGLGLPFILTHRDNAVGHRLVFDLQGAVVVSGFINEYTKTLDVNVSAELLQMRILSVLSLLNMIGVRGISTTYSYYVGLTIMYAEKRWALMCFGAVVGALFLTFNVFICLVPSYKRCVKFLTKRPTTTTTTTTTTVATKERRPSSVVVRTVDADEKTSCIFSSKIKMRNRRVLG